MSHTPPVDSKGAAIDDVLRQFRQYLLHGIMSDTPHQMTFDEAVEAILALLAQEVNNELPHIQDFYKWCEEEGIPEEIMYKVAGWMGSEIYLRADRKDRAWLGDTE